MATTDQKQSYTVIESSLNDDVIEIRLSDIVAFWARSRRKILIGAIIGGVIGGIYAFSKANEYTSQLTVLPELQAKSGPNLGNLGSLAGLAGIDVSGMTSGTDAIRPELYPNVLQSTPFALALFKTTIYTQADKRIKPLDKYLIESNGTELSWLPFFVSSDVEDVGVVAQADTNGALRMTKTQESLAKALRERIVGTYEKKSGVLTITATMQDPVVAATTVRNSLIYLTNYITTYRTEKARREVEFLNRQVANAKQRYQMSEYSLSNYRDRNRSLFLNTAKIEEQRIQAEFLLSQELYNTLSKQSEMAKIKVQEETPVFKILEPARVPLKKSGPKRFFIVLTFAFAGLIGILIMEIIKQLRRSSR